jgi:hypothetical protein
MEIHGVMEGANKWFAMALSTDTKMGDDSVTECTMLSNGQGAVRTSWNSGKQNRALGIVNGATAMVRDGHIYCKWRAQAVTTVQQKQFDIKKNYILAAMGPNNGDAKTYHGNDQRTGSSSIVDLTLIQNLMGTQANSIALVHAHGSLMVIAWIGFVSVGTTIARHYKPVWGEQTLAGNKVWFTLHRGLMVTTVLCHSVAIILIFSFVQGWSGNVAHAYVGAVTTVLMCTQAIGALFRCHPGDEKRWIFNWVHFILGNTTHITAIATIFLAQSLPLAKLDQSFIGVVAAYIVTHVVVQLVLQVLTQSEKNSKTEDIAMNDMSIETKSATVKKQKFKRVILAMYVVAVLAFVIALIILIAM